MEGESHGNKRHSIGHTVNDIVTQCLRTDGSYICKHSIMYELVEPPRFTPETNVILCVDDTQKSK